jgi:carboxyl-terminal processing protease
MFRRSLIIPAVCAVVFSSVVVGIAQRSRRGKIVPRGVIATVTGTATVPVLPPDIERRYETFITVWSTIRDNYFDKSFNGLDWNAVRTEFEPKVKNSKSDSEVHTLLNSMLGRLNRSHLAVIPPEVYRTLSDVQKLVKARESAGDPGKSADLSAGTADDKDDLEVIDENAKYGIGVELSLVGDRFMITRMDENSAAEYAGLKRGFVLDKVNGISLQEMLNRIMIYNSSIHSTSVKQFVPAYVVSAMLNGNRDSYVTVGYLDEADQPKEVRIRREPLKERSISIASNFPPQQLSFESRSIDDSTGYIRFNFFAMPVIDRFCRAIGDFKSKSGLIIDLRGNTGGVLASVPTLAGMLTADSLDLGTSIYRTRSEPLKASSKTKNFKGRIVVLVDDRTASAAEMFALSLRDDGRALIVGQHTSGEALPSVMVSLPTGAKLLYPFANYKSPAGTFIEGNGIEPDKTVAIDRTMLLSGKDVQLDAAVNILGDQAAFSKLKPKRPSVDTALSGTESGDPPPAAKPLAKNNSSAVSPPKMVLSAAPTSTGRKFPLGQDAASKRYIEAFLKSLGGIDSLRGMNSLSASGVAELRLYGTTNQFKFKSYRSSNTKFSEILESDATGEIREVTDGEKHWLQTDFGLDQDLSKIPGMESSDLFSPITDLATYTDSYPSLSYTGTFDRDGRKTAVLEGKSKSGREVALAFDVETGFLVNVTKGYSSVSFADYRKVGELTLPFEIEQTGVIMIRLDQMTVNSLVDNSVFERKQNCYDKVD